MRHTILSEIFDVNMLLRYGEVDKAFIRIQEGIMRSAADMNILKWQLREGNNIQNPPLRATTSDTVTGLLASFAADSWFVGVSRIQPEMDFENSPYRTLASSIVQNNILIWIVARWSFHCSGRNLRLGRN